MASSDRMLDEARAHTTKGRYAEAIRAAHEAVLLQPDRARAHATLAVARAAAGDLTGAVKAIDRACALAPENEQYLGRRRRLLGEQAVYGPGWIPRITAPHPFPPPSQDEGLRVLHLQDRTLPFRQSGYTVRSRNIVVAQRRAGLRPVVASRLGFPEIDGGAASSRVDEVEGVPHHRLTSANVADHRSLPLDEYLERYAGEAVGLVERIRPHVLHPATSFGNGLVGLALGDAYGIPVVYEVRGFPWDVWVSEVGGEEGSDRYQGRIEAELRCMRGADHVVTIADVMKAWILEQGIPAERVTVVPNAVDIERFSPVPRDQGLEAALDLEGRVVIGYVSTLVGYEGIEVLLRAVALLAERDLPVACLIVGDGPEWDRLHELARDLGIEQLVRFPGQVPHDRIMDHYALIDVFVVPRRDLPVCRSVTPLKPFEAMAMGIPVVVSDLPALREIAAPEERGLAFVPEQPASLATEVERLLLDEQLRRRLGEAGRGWVRRERTWSRNVDRYTRVYREVLARGRRRVP